MLGQLAVSSSWGGAAVLLDFLAGLALETPCGEETGQAGAWV